MTATATKPRRPTARAETSPPVEDAASLMARVARADVDAFNALYGEMASPVYRAVHVVIRDAALAEEVTQEVLLSVWSTASCYDPTRGSVGAWVHTMARRRAVDRVRSEQAARNRNDRYGHASTARAFDDVAETVEAKLEHLRVVAALGKLPARQREVVELAYYGGHSYRRVAELLDTPLGTVKTRMRAGLLRLRNELATDDEPGPSGWR